MDVGCSDWRGRDNFWFMSQENGIHAPLIFHGVWETLKNRLVEMLMIDALSISSVCGFIVSKEKWLIKN